MGEGSPHRDMGWATSPEPPFLAQLSHCSWSQRVRHFPLRGNELAIPGSIQGPTLGILSDQTWDPVDIPHRLPPQIPESCRPNMEEGISLFSSLLNNKHFLIVFVHALEQQKDFAVRDRSGCSAGSGEG